MLNTQTANNTWWEIKFRDIGKRIDERYTNADLKIYQYLRLRRHMKITFKISH